MITGWIKEIGILEWRFEGESFSFLLVSVQLRSLTKVNVMYHPRTLNLRPYIPKGRLDVQGLKDFVWNLILNGKPLSEIV